MKTDKKNQDRVEAPSAANGDPSWLESGIDIDKLNRRMKLLKILGGKKKTPEQDSPLTWLLNPNVNSDTQQQINDWHANLLADASPDAVVKKVFRAIEEISGDPLTHDDSIVALGAAHAVRAIAGKCEYSQWLRLVSRILEISQAAASDVELSPDVYQQLAIEVPITIAFQVPEVENFHASAEKNCRKLTTMISDMLDHDGWPHARYLSCFGPLVASWVRCYAILSKLGIDTGFEAASQLEWMVRQVLRMIRPEGTLVFSEQNSNRSTGAFLDLLLKLSNDPDDKRLLKRVMEKSKSNRTVKDLPKPSNLSEWSESAILQSDWGRNSPRVAVDFSNNNCGMEISRHCSLIQGDAMPAVTLNGVELISDEPFEVVCIESDDDVEYLELGRGLGQGVVLTRQILLSRSEKFLLVADAIIPESAARIDYRCRWPLANEIEGMHETETREIYLHRKNKIQSLVLPLALPEWKAGRTDDRLDFQDGQLCLTQSIDGRGLYAPLFFDLNRKRSSKKRTWRQVTIGEDRSAVPRDVACAFRVQLDESQWVFYRAITEKGNRTFMGENLSSEFFFGRFGKNGKVQQLIEID